MVLVKSLMTACVQVLTDAKLKYRCKSLVLLAVANYRHSQETQEVRMILSYKATITITKRRMQEMFKSLCRAETAWRKDNEIHA